MPALDDIRIFVKVAQLESFSRAARALGMPVSTVSRRISGLEAQLGVTLLQRTTRRLSLTGQGRSYFNECQEPLTQLLDAEHVLTQTQRKTDGLLRVTVPVVLSGAPFMDFVAQFLRTYPGIRLDLFITNVFVDLVAENTDVAIRFGEQRDSSVVARRIGTSVRYLVATSGYLKDRGTPRLPQDLREHACVLMHGKNNEADWDLCSGRKRARIRVSGPVSSRDFNSVSEFTHRGLGIGFLPANYCKSGIDARQLMRVLPKWSSVPIPVFTVYPTRKFLPARVQAFLEALAAWKSPAWERD